MNWKSDRQYRVPEYNYAIEGLYFVTICTHQRATHFGTIEDKIFFPSSIGKFVEANIGNLKNSNSRFTPKGVDSQKTPKGVDFQETSKDQDLQITPNTTGKKGIHELSGFKRVSIEHHSILPDHIHFILEVPVQSTSGQFINAGLRPLIQGSVESWVNHFKGYVTRWCRDNNCIEFKWQRRFHDHVIRDEKEHLNIIQYIDGNVANWKL